MVNPLVFIVACDDHIFSGGAGRVELTGGGSIEDVQAIIDAQCLAYGGSGGLSLEGDLCDATVNVSANGYAGTLIVPGDHQASIFWHKSANTGDYGQGMPIPGGLSAAEAQALAEWIDAGASCETDVAEPSQPDAPPDTGEQPGAYAAIVATFQLWLRGDLSRKHGSGSGKSLSGDECNGWGLHVSGHRCGWCYALDHPQ